MSENTITLRHYALLLLLSVVWGSSYFLIKKGLIAYSPTQLASLRIAISSLAFLPFFVLKYQEIDWSKFKELAIVGFAGSFIPAFLFSFAQTEISSSIAGVLSSLTPLFTLILGVIFYNIKAGWAKYFGVLLGLSGAAILILFGKSAGATGNLWYGLLVVAGCFFYAISANTVKAGLQDMGAMTLSTGAFMIIGPFALAYLAYSGAFAVMMTPVGQTSLLAVSVLAIFGTVIASVLFFKLVQMTTPLFGSMVSYLIPIVAVFLGAWDGEPIVIVHWIGMGLILGGVYFARGK